MKILLEIEKIGVISKDPNNWVVGDNIKKDKEGIEYVPNPRYFGSLKGALEEIRQVYIDSHLLKSHKTCKELSVFLDKIDKANKSFSKLLNKITKGD